MSDVYKIERGENRITLFSAYRMPHPSRKGPMDRARRELRAAIIELNALPGQLIDGVYSSQLEGYFDIENVVFYNVEPSTFRNSAKYGLRARRCRLHKEEHSPGFPHKMEYRLISTPTRPTSVLAKFSFTMGMNKNVFDVWWVAGMIEPVNFNPVEGTYGIYVELECATPPQNPATRIKTLFDGVVASLQRDSQPDPIAVQRLSQRHGVLESRIEVRLKNPVISAIQASMSRRLVRPYGNYVQWHPADDQCEECTLIVSQNATEVCNVYVYALPNGLATVDD